MRKAASIIALAMFVFASIPAADLHAEDKRILTVTAVTHDSRVNERTSYHTTPEKSETACTGTGTGTGTVTGDDIAIQTRTNTDCTTTTAPAKTSSTTTRTTDVSEKVMDSENTVYTIACTDRPNVLAAVIVGAAAGGGGGGGTLAGRGNCIPLIDGDRFQAEIKGTTMWVHALKGGNQGKAIKIKYKILDIRKLTPQSTASNGQCRGDEQDISEVWRLGRRTGGKDSEITKSIQTFGVCGTLSRLREMDTRECRGNQWDVDRTVSLGESLGGNHDEIMDAIKQHGVCSVFTYLRGEADGRPSQPKSATSSFGLSSSSPPSVPPPPSSKSDTYTGVGGGHWIQESSNNGAIVTLEDGSLWEISAVDRVDTALWLPTTSITVLESRSPVGDYKYVLINKDDGEKALAKYLGRE